MLPKKPSIPSLSLKPGREKSVLRRHPWIFSGAVARIDGNPEAGGTIEVRTAAGGLLGHGAYSPSSQIRTRLWSFDPSEQVDVDFFRRRIARAIRLRAGFHAGLGEALRLIYAESDGLPGLIVDRYADTLVAQLLTSGTEFWKETLTDLLLELTGLKQLYERSDADVRELEGLPPRQGPLRGTPTETCTITENGLRFRVDIGHGHKTGFYLDQCPNRLRVRSLADGREVLDCFCYTGGFSVNALAGGARSVLSVDTSEEALALCREHVLLNHLPAQQHETLAGDVFQVLRKLRDEGRTFDLIVLDPPKFAPTAALAEKAARGYKDINLLGFKLLRPGGILVTFSCSAGVDAALFQKIVASAALDAAAEAQILEHLSQGPDHPVALHFPEGAYLKGLVCLKA